MKANLSKFCADKSQVKHERKNIRIKDCQVNEEYRTEDIWEKTVLTSGETDRGWPYSALRFGMHVTCQLTVRLFIK